MLVHQAAAQLAIWTGSEPPVEAMWEAAERSSPLSG
jgi:shikimate 5-dehydrogenase